MPQARESGSTSELQRQLSRSRRTHAPGDALGYLFEQWACLHISFDELNDVWPYVLEDKFGAACLEYLNPDGLTQFDESDCLRVALHLRLPVMLDEKLPLAIDVRAANPIIGSAFQEFRIQTVRTLLEDNDIVPFGADDDPLDENFGPLYFGIYGAGADGLLEHIADRTKYADAVELVMKLAPGIQFPKSPTAKFQTD